MATPPMPIPATLANNFGAARGGALRHRGLDIPPSTTDDVVAPEAGVVKVEVPDPSGKTAGASGFGPAFVRITTDDGNVHTLAHLDVDSLRVGNGQRVTEGQRIGSIARGVTPSQFWSAPHVHWEVNDLTNKGPFDPMLWLRSSGVKRPLVNSSAWLWLALGIALAIAIERR